MIERIEIDQATGSTAGRMLAMLEAPFGYGQPVAFQGAVEFIADDDEAKAIAAALDQAFRWVPAFGALRTVGFGRTHCVKIIPVACPKRSRGSVPQKTSLAVRLRLDRPLCLVGRKHSGNHFESLETIPGAVLKGAVARLILELSGLKDDRFLDPAATYPRWPSLCKHFEVIRFAEARPMAAAATHRPVEPPLSIVTSPTIKCSYFDVALGSGPMLIGGAAPAFVPDWKDEDFGLVRECVRLAVLAPRDAGPARPSKRKPAAPRMKRCSRIAWFFRNTRMMAARSNRSSGRPRSGWSTSTVRISRR